MNNLKKIFNIIIIFFILYILFKYNKILEESVIEATILWLKKVFPFLFIMFIFNDVIINTNYLNILDDLFGNIFNIIFNTTGKSCKACLLSLLSGCPSSAFILKEMVNNGDITLNDANKLISFTYFPNPLFLYNILGTIFNEYLTIKIILISYLSNILLGIIIRNRKSNINITVKSSQIKSKNKTVLELLPKAINKSINMLLTILGVIVFYMILTNLIIKIVSLSPLLSTLLKGILEITGGLNSLGNINYPSNIKEIIALLIISFGGLSIHTQIKQILDDTQIDYKYFLIGRIWQLIIATLASYFICM